MYENNQFINSCDIKITPYYYQVLLESYPDVTVDKRQPTEYNSHFKSGNFLFPQSQRKFLKERHKNAFVLFLLRISSKSAFISCPCRDLAQKVTSQGSTLVATYS